MPKMRWRIGPVLRATMSDRVTTNAADADAALAVKEAHDRVVTSHLPAASPALGILS